MMDTNIDGPLHLSLPLNRELWQHISHTELATPMADSSLLYSSLASGLNDNPTTLLGCDGPNCLAIRAEFDTPRSLVVGYTYSNRQRIRPMNEFPGKPSNSRFAPIKCCVEDPSTRKGKRGVGSVSTVPWSVQRNSIDYHNSGTVCGCGR